MIELGDAFMRDVGIIENSKYFNPEWYRDAYPDVDLSEISPAAHYLLIGALLGRDPGPCFSTLSYLEMNPDVRASGINPLVHFSSVGSSENRHIEPSDPNLGSENLPRFGKREYGAPLRYVRFDSERKKYSGSFRICVYLHLFHLDLAEELLVWAGNIIGPFTLLVSVAPQICLKDVEVRCKGILGSRCQVIVRKQENRGRDLLGLVCTFREEICAHDIVLHIHSKRSEYDSAYRDWRRYLLHNSLSPAIVDSILSWFECEAQLNLVSPPYFPNLPRQPQWGANRDTVTRLTRTLGWSDPPSACLNFPAGSFFWSRVDAIRPLLDLNLSPEDFDPEEGQIDGTLAHALERLIGLAAIRKGGKYVFAACDVSYNLVNYWDSRRTARLLQDSRPREITSRRAELPEEVRGLRIAVLTCVVGGFESLVSPPTSEAGVDWYCVSDDVEIIPSGYRRLDLPYHDISPRRCARWVKTNPQYALPDYDVVVWVDANIVLLDGVGPLVARVVKAQGDLGYIPHPLRRTARDEASECARISADDPDVLAKQISCYEAEGRKEVDLAETNILVSLIGSPRVQEFYKLWGRELRRHSLRDQVSFGVSAFESGVRMVPLLDRGYSARDSAGILMFAHNCRDRVAVVSEVMRRRNSVAHS